MRIDRRHRAWLAGTLIASGVAAGLGHAAARTEIGSPGSTWPGLILGGVASALVVFSALLGVRRKLLRAPLGTMPGWLRAHLWLGALTLVCGLCHGGFRLGGFLTSALTLVLGVCVGSGMLGALLQHVLPSSLSQRGAIDRIREPVHAIAALRRRAYELVWAACGRPPEDGAAAADPGSFDEPPHPPPRDALRQPGTLLGQQQLALFYRGAVMPFLRGSGESNANLGTAADATLAFDALTAALDPQLHPALQALSELCEQVRQARRQILFQRLIQGWLLLHVPLAMALLVLLVLHLLTVLRY